jgi:protein-arginine kinase activator protein McsA
LIQSTDLCRISAQRAASIFVLQDQSQGAKQRGNVCAGCGVGPESRHGKEVHMDTKREQQLELQLNPGDEAPPGTPGTGEAVCPECGGTGKLRSGKCANCGGTGKVIKAIGGA